MIYVKIEDSLVKLSLETNEYDSVVYSLDWNLEILLETLRPWKELRANKDQWFKLSVIDEFFEKRKFETETPQETYEKFSPNLYNEIISVADELEKYGLISKIKPIPNYQLEYNCDILNMLEEVYSSSGLEIIQDFFDLTDNELKTIRGFYKELTKDRKLEYLFKQLSQVKLENIISYLPSWCKDELKVFGSEEVNTKVDTLPEYRNLNTLIINDTEGRKKEMVDEIYKEFEIGSVLRGSEIRTRLRNIYSKYGLNPKATIVNFMEYFVISKARSEYEWFYRIVRRRS